MDYMAVEDRNVGPNNRSNRGEEMREDHAYRN